MLLRSCSRRTVATVSWLNSATPSTSANVKQQQPPLGRNKRKQASSEVQQQQKQAMPSSPVDIGQKFMEESVQSLLVQLTGLSTDKTFHHRRTHEAKRPHFMLMSDQELNRTLSSMEQEASKFLKFVPFLEPRSDKTQQLAVDDDIAGFDTAKFIFTDLTVGIKDRDRLVVVREPSGLLRSANPEEHDRMNRIYYPRIDAPPNPPAVFREPQLTNALNRDQHVLVLDWAAWFYEPDNSAYVQLAKAVYDHADCNGKHKVLWATRHYGGFVFYLVLNRMINEILLHYANSNSLSDCATVIRLYSKVHGDWKRSVKPTHSDEKVVQDFNAKSSHLVGKECSKAIAKLLGQKHQNRDSV